MIEKISKFLQVVKDHKEDAEKILDASITIISTIEKIAKKSS